VRIQWGMAINVRCESVVGMGALLGELRISENSDRDLSSSWKKRMSGFELSISIHVCYFLAFSLCQNCMAFNSLLVRDGIAYAYCPNKIHESVFSIAVVAMVVVC